MKGPRDERPLAASVGSIVWLPRTMGEHLRSSYTSCGMTQSEWSAIAVKAPSTAPE
jgi:hypothetical protein